jgi:hypothetical protein
MAGTVGRMAERIRRLPAHPRYLGRRRGGGERRLATEALLRFDFRDPGT